MSFKSFDLRKAGFVLAFVFVFGFCVQVSFASTITGIIYGLNRTPLSEVDVELLNENYQLRDRTRTDGSGRYEFRNLADGFYTIRALPFRYDYQDEEVRVSVSTVDIRGSGLGNTYVQRDINLSPRKGGITEYELGVVFAQDVPKEARQAYKNADKAFAGKRDQEGVDELFKAIQIFPDYYEALYRMGKELYTLKKYDEAWKFLLKATEVNPKSGVAFYYMGECFYNLDYGKETLQYNKAAITSLKQAAQLIPNMPQVFFTLGKAERLATKYEDAEEHLLQAKKLAKQPVAQIQKELAQLYANDLKKYKEAADELELYLKASKLSDEEEKVIRDKIADLRQKAN
jgi:tetratricopeptide (TPR) repeat protein